MNGKFLLGALLVIVLIAGAAGVGAYAFRMGVAQGLAESGKLTAPPTGVAPYPYFAPFHYRAVGHGFGLLSCLAPLLFVFLVFGLMRAMIWRGHWGWKHHGPHAHGEKGVPPMFEEWHRKMHETQNKPNESSAA
ncbi:MAG: hypothetical protein HZC40_19320 [Chloroflexi bacterium]|nr:hypothetical protein [Chloroflexota bacterium]